MVRHFDLRLKPRERGIHLITQEVVDAVEEWPKDGLLHVFIRHTSAALALNENADPDVRHDLMRDFDRLVPQSQPYYRHTMEGPDDMPSHTLSIFCGSSLSIPIRDGRPDMGTWQGIYLCEFRDHMGARRLTLTVIN